MNLDIPAQVPPTPAAPGRILPLQGSRRPAQPRRALRRILTLGAALTLVGVTSATADVNTDTLYPYQGNAASGYGYNQTTPVPLYPGSATNIEIPVDPVQPIEQFRSAWVGTIQNLHFPRVSSEAEFSTHFSAILDTYEDWNMNAVIFQVRPLLDAWYSSEINPWSEFITGTQGTDPGFDPLHQMVQASHERGLEFHAWFNPYRVTNTKISQPAVLERIGLSAAEARELSVADHITVLNEAGILSDDNYAVLNPDRVQMFDEKLFLDPAYEENRSHVADTITEVVTNYDVDAIHFDDYFYPYRITVDGQNVHYGDADEDRLSFETFGLTTGYEDSLEGIESWRRDNITKLISDVKERIDTHNSATGAAVQFGISPFGIWEHHANDERGSHTPTGSSQSYSGAIFADTRGWIVDELIDYVVPQIYWSFDQAAAPYGELATWWNDVSAGSRTQLYVGHANYKHAQNGGWEAAWMNPEEIPHQMRFNQTLPHIQGSAFYSYRDILPSQIDTLPADQQARNQAKNDGIEILKADHFSQPALIPAKNWLSTGTPGSPTDVTLDPQAQQLNWTAPTGGARYYAIYSGSGSADEIISTPGNLIDRIWAGDAEQLSWTLPADSADQTWVVTTLDRAAVQSTPSVATNDSGDGDDDGEPGNGNDDGEPGNGNDDGEPGNGNDGTGTGDEDTDPAPGAGGIGTGTMPDTGTDPAGLIALGLATLIGGTALTVLARRRSATH